MESVSGPNGEEQKPIFTLAGEANLTTTTDSYSFSDKIGSAQEATTLSSISSILSATGGNDMLNMGSQQEPRVADTAPTVAEMEELLSNIRLNGSDMFSDDTSLNNYFTGYSRADSESSNTWPDNSTHGSRNAETMDTFDFLVKSLWSANKYVSMLTFEQLTMLRSIRPSLLYAFLQEVAKARSDRRTRRVLPNECAFCKNNGENEECYSSHALKDWRGRVLCPVLRAFCCPRCGATGDRAHTIKYCPEPADTGSSSSLSSRRRMPPSSSLLLGAGGARAHLPPPAASPATTPVNNALSYSALWSNFNMN